MANGDDTMQLTHYIEEYEAAERNFEMSLSEANPNPNPSTWAELVWRYLLEVTSTVIPSSIPRSTLKTRSNPDPNPNPGDELVGG